jgi:hypothetical protein
VTIDSGGMEADATVCLLYIFSIKGYARISLLKSNEITELLIATVQMTENKLLHLQTPRVYQTPAAKRHPAIEGHKNHTG